jgi:hypothetical protein
MHEYGAVGGRELARETEALGENLHQFFRQIYLVRDVGWNPRRRDGKPACNRVANANRGQ